MENPFSNPLLAIKAVYSTMLLLFSIVVIMATILDKNTQLAHDVHPALAIVVIWVAVLWLSMVEGGQAALVGLPPVRKELYQDSHPKTHKCTVLAHAGDNLDRYLIGRQFLVLMIVFCTNLAGRPLQDDTSSLFNNLLPEVVNQIFVVSGVAMIIMTTNIGQLASQVNASHCMLDYINNYFMLATLYVALAIEFSGLLHAVYVVQALFAYISGTPVNSAEPQPRGFFASMFFFGRVYMSLLIVGGCFAVTLKALFDGKTTMWEGVPNAVAVILFFVLLSIVGMLEGMQIAFYAVSKLTRAEQAEHPVAMKTCELLFRGEGQRNLPGFMIGRQILVTMCFFFIARVTTLDVDVEAGDETVFGVSARMQKFFNTGLLGAILTTVVGSLSWQLVASAFPVAFLSNPLVYGLLRLCLLLEATGICSASWVLAALHKRCAGFQKDEVFIGTPEERAANNHQDDEDFFEVQSGHLFPGVPTLPRHMTRYKRVKQNSVKFGDELFPAESPTDSSDVEITPRNNHHHHSSSNLRHSNNNV